MSGTRNYKMVQTRASVVETFLRFMNYPKNSEALMEYLKRENDRSNVCIRKVPLAAVKRMRRKEKIVCVCVCVLK
jgi:hypothetical protein